MPPILDSVIRRGVVGLTMGLLAVAPGIAPMADPKPVLVGIDGEFGLQNSTSAQAIELGVRIAIAQINEAGGVLNGRPLEVVTKDNRSIPARGIRNIEEFAAMPDLVAVFGGRFSPVVIEELPTLKEAKLPFLAVWSEADVIIDNGTHPNYAFRLSLRDSLAMPFMLRSAQARNLKRVGLLRGAGAQAIVRGANDDEAAILVREVAALPPAQRVPIISHWGITGDKFAQAAGLAFPRIEVIESPVGMAHAYDMMHILARAIDLAGSTDRVAVRSALEKVPEYDGLVRRYAPPFTPTRHEALGEAELLMARYRPDGVLVPIKP